MDSRQQNSNLKKIAGLILSGLMIALTAYVLNLQEQNTHVYKQSTELALTAGVHQASNYRAYVQHYQETKAQLEETTQKLEEVNHQLDLVSTELETTKALLTESKTLLTQAQDENAKLKAEIQSLDALRLQEGAQDMDDLKTKITALKEKNVEVSTELDSLRQQLRAFAGEFSNLAEGKSLVILFRQKIALVKTRMKLIKQEAYFARVAAQKEKDRLESLNGNSGFMVRNGAPQKTTATNKTFAIDVKLVQ